MAAHPRSCDVLMVDGYDGHEQVPELSLGVFTPMRARRSPTSGMLVVNLWSSDTRFDAYLQRIERVSTPWSCVPAERRGNVVVLLCAARRADRAGTICGSRARAAADTLRP